MKVNIGLDNENFIKQVNEKIGLSPDEAVNRALIYYRAMKTARTEIGADDPLKPVEFGKGDIGKIGLEPLHVYLGARFKIENRVNFNLKKNQKILIEKIKEITRINTVMANMIFKPWGATGLKENAT